MAEFRGQEQIEFLTIEPAPGNDADETDSTTNVGKFSIVDSRIIEQESDQKALLDAFEAAANAGNPIMAMGCFNPRHALRLPNDPEIYVLICFECNRAKYSKDDPNKYMTITSMDNASSAIFNKYVEELGMTTSEH